jgi:predicted Zn-dependent peptidase
MAHLLEHVAYMGSPKRQLISGTGSRTNAYTDFHHTVFFAACPTQTPDQFWKRPMLPMALDALLDVMTCNVDDDRLEKERAAVLSEASMVNKMEYRVECQILSALHEENRISRRFPIGKEHLIRAWKKEDLQLYHNTHYRPDNVVLFVVGDVDVPTTIECINEKFGNLRPKLDARKVLRESGEFPELSMREVWRHFPPVTHQWSCTAEEAQARVPSSLVRPLHEVSTS